MPMHNASNRLLNEHMHVKPINRSLFNRYKNIIANVGADAG